MSHYKGYNRLKGEPKHPVIKPDGTLKLPPISLPNPGGMSTNVNLLNFRLSKARKNIEDKMLLEKAVKRYEKKKEIFDAMPKPAEPQYPREMMSEGRIQRMHYETLRKCVQNVPIPEIQRHWIEGVLKLIPKSFSRENKLQNAIDNLISEMKSDFINVLKELTVNKTLISPEEFQKQDGRARRAGRLKILATAKSVGCLSRLENFAESRKKVSRNLFLYRQSVVKVFEFGELFLEGRIVCDFQAICQKSPISLKQLNALVSKGCDSFEENVMSKWFPEVVKIVKKHMNFENIKPHQTSGYHRCLDTIMSVQLRGVLRDSLDAWMDLLTLAGDKKGLDNKYPGLYFQVAMTFEDGEMQFYPSLEDFKTSLCEVVDKIVGCLQMVPSILSYTSEDPNFQDYHYIPCKVFQEDVEMIYVSIEKIIKKRFEEAEDHLKWLKDFVHLVDGRSMLEIEKAFIDSNKSFDDYLEVSHSYKGMANEISLLPRVVTLDLLAVDCDDIKRDFVKAAKLISQYILNEMASHLFVEAKRISSDYNQVYSKASSSPDSSEELIDLIEFIESARVGDLIKLEKRVEEYASRLLRLTECYLIPAEHLSLNIELFQWRDKISPVFDQSGERTESLKILARRMLETSSQKLFDEIEQIRRRSEEFNEYTDVDQMGFYAKVVKDVQMRLANVVERGRWINREERMHKVPVTNFQEAEDVSSILELYYRLFLVVSKWMKAEKRWMDGTFLELSAGQIESDLEEYTQELYKVNKQLSNRFRKSMKKDTMVTKEGEGEQPPVLSVISKVLEAMKKFRSNIPVIMVLCNLGLRSRHWQQMSEVAMFDLTPDSSTTLRRMLAINLGPFMEQFEIISTSASKEYSLEKAMNKMKEDWVDVAFSVTQYRDTGLSILASVDEVQMMLEDQIVKTQTMRGSPFIKPFEKEVKAWEVRMIFIQYTIVEWLKVQSQWLYLSPIFSSEDITRQMPNESRMFEAVDGKWRSLMAYLASHPLVTNRFLVFFGY